MDNRIVVPLDGTESVEEILLYVTSITPSDATEIALLTVVTGNNTDASGDAHAGEIFAVTERGKNIAGHCQHQFAAFSLREHGRKALFGFREGF